METNSNREKPVKIFFHLQKDEDGYPPNDWEAMWGYEVESGLYSLDNVPFFANGVSWKDVVSVERKDNELHFNGVIQPSGHSVLRVIAYDQSMTAKIHEELRKLGCGTEQSHLPSLLSVDVPPSVQIRPILEFLSKGFEDDLWDYEEACMRHPDDLEGD